MRLRLPFFWKLFAGHALLILVATGLVGGILALRVTDQALEETDRRLVAVASMLRELARLEMVQEAGGPFEERRLQGRIEELGRESSARLTVIATDGTVVADSHNDPRTMDDHSRRPEVVDALESGRGSSSRFSRTMRQRMRFLALPLMEEGRALAVVRASVPLDVIDERLSGLRDAVLSAVAVGILVALGLGFLFHRQVSRPLLSMAEAAQRIAEGAYDQKVEAPPGGDELSTLARAFNSMSQQLRASVAAMSADHDKLMAILRSMGEGLVAVDRDERIMHVNEVAGRLLDLDPDAVISRPIWEAARLHEVSDAISEVLATETTVSRVVRRPGAPDRILELRGSPLLTEEGLAGAVLLLDDVTHLRRLETMRRDFVGNVSHELKTPLTAIRGMVETLLEDDDATPEVKARFLARVATQAERMQTLVSDLLSLSRLESDADGLDLLPVDLRRPVRQSIRALQTAREAREIVLETDLPAEPVMVEGEEESLRQAVTNLLDNAIKYSPAGSRVEVRICREPPPGPGDALPELEPAREWVVLEVEDDGPGIEAIHRERLFERFYRVDKARSRALGGTGLGLAIVKHIALALGGRVSVESTPGVGSTFRIHLREASES